MTMTATNVELRRRIEGILREADVDAFVHAADIDREAAVGVDPDRSVVTASTFKVFVLLTAATQAQEGRISWTDRVTVGDAQRTLGPTGLSVMKDEVELSLRDLSVLMMQVSDNTATDFLQGIVTTEAVMATVRRLGLTGTIIEGDCRDLLAKLRVELSLDAEGEPTEEVAERAKNSPSLRAETGNRTTPRDMTRLLCAVWRDEAGPPEACAWVRHVMGLQFAPHRLSTAFGDGVTIAGKTGTLFGGIRNEVGVFTFPDGGRYAVAVYLHQKNLRLHDARADRAVGDIAREAVNLLREGAGSRS